MYSSHPDLLLALAGLDDVVGGLHSHESVHLHPKSLFDAQGAMSPERSALPLSMLDSAGRDTASAAAAGVTDKPEG